MKEKSNIILKELTPRMVSKEYVNWMNNYEITKYTEQKYTKHTMASIKKFVAGKKKSKYEFLYGIFLRKKNKHIGNIKLGPINFTHKYAIISYFIGNKNFWGKNCATKAIGQVVKIAKKMRLKKLEAGFYEMNYGSKKVLKKNNFKLEGILKSRYLYKNKRCNSFIYGLIL